MVMTDERKRLFDHLADELYGIAEKYRGQPAGPGARARLENDLLELGRDRYKGRVDTEISGQVGEDGHFTITVSTRDRGLIAEWANRGLLEDPAAHGLIQIDGTWMWPPVVLVAEVRDAGDA
jgi:hypothetical protein